MPQSIRTQNIAGLAVGIAILVQPVLAQKPGGTPGGGGAGGGIPTRNVPGPTGPTPGISNNSINQGIYLSGKVVMDDGTPPPEPVTIERVCDTSARAQAYTDQKGRFSFQMGQTAGILQDASEDATIPGAQTRPVSSIASGPNSPPTNLSDSRLATCELRAMLAGYRSDTVNISGRRLMDDPDVGTIVLHRLANVAGTVVSMTSLAAPNDARRAYEKGLIALHKHKQPEAGKDFQKAVDIYPKYAVAWYELGRIQEQEQNVAGARASYEKALAADPRFMSPYVQLAELAARARNWIELADTTDRLLQLDPMDYAFAYFDNAVANLNLGRMKEAEKSARAGLKVDTSHRFPKLAQVLARTLERKGDYAGAAENMRLYLQLAPDAEDAAKMRIRIGELDRLAGVNQEAKSSPSSKDNPSAGGPPQPPR
ncbi:MAG: tetratricopeptide repeat protein [Bryobacteraceae bacterium]|jgi:tetratricopeptide (TPR) repeat protein